MDATTALVEAARGLRTTFGRFPSSEQMQLCIVILEEISTGMARIATLEQDSTLPRVKADELTELAVARRLKHLGVPAEYHGAGRHDASCQVGCQHGLVMLLMQDKSLVRVAINSKKQHDLITRSGQFREEISRALGGAEVAEIAPGQYLIPRTPPEELPDLPDCSDEDDDGPL